MFARKLLAAAVLLGGLGVAARAQDPKAKDDPKGLPKPEDAKALDRAELDRRLARTAFDTSAFGSELWKAGSFEGTYRLYQATLATMRPLLDHRPKLQATVTDRLDKSMAMKPTEGAFVLREGLDAIQKECGEALVGSAAWVRLGGEPGVRAVVGDFVLAAATDPKVNITRGGKVPFDRRAFLQLEQALVEYVSGQVGGPVSPTGADVKAVLGGLKLTDAEFDAAAGHLDAVLKKYKVPAADADAAKKLFGELRKDVVAR